MDSYETLTRWLDFLLYEVFILKMGFCSSFLYITLNKYIIYFLENIFSVDTYAIQPLHTKTENTAEDGAEKS